ncbi:MAG: glycosyltransferase [Candidatus Aenigmarchaeota archaeon]|nr:glycosyltransferase [Candidatus Aenigmarchaeota archaeon]
MKLLIANDFFAPTIAGGADLFLKEMAIYLKDEGFEPVILTSSFVKETGFKTYRIESSPFHFRHMRQIPGLTLPWNFSTAVEKKVSGIIEKEKIDFFYANNTYHLSFSVLTAAQKMGIPSLLDVHDYWPICFSKDLYKDDRGFCQKGESWECSTCLSKKFSAPLFPLAIPLLRMESRMKKDVLSGMRKVCHSEFVKKQLGKYGYESEVIPYPFFGKHGTREHGKRKIVFVGRLTKNKGADLLVPLAQALNDVEIDVIGKGPLSSKLDRKDIGINLRGFMGDERFDILKGASALVAPSRWPEPFGIVALEAAAYGIPTIALKGSGGLAELVSKEGIGKVCYEDGLAECVMDVIEKTAEYESRCKAAMKNYDKDAIFKRYRKLFETRD